MMRANKSIPHQGDKSIFNVSDTLLWIGILCYLKQITSLNAADVDGEYDIYVAEVEHCLPPLILTLKKK